MFQFFFLVDFFIALDHENGPITMHSSLSKVVKYVHAGLQKLKQMWIFKYARVLILFAAIFNLLWNHLKFKM